MMNKMRKSLGFITAALIPLASASHAFAGGVSICPAGSEFTELCSITAENIAQYIGIILSIMLGIAVIIAIFFLVWGGIKWILSGGDKAAVDEARKHIIAALVGLVIAFLAFFLISIVGRLFGINVLNFTLPSLTG